MAAASGRIRRLRRIDRFAVLVITLGGIGVVAAVLGILVFVAGQAIPLFRGAAIERTNAAAIDSSLASGAHPALRAIGTDEYRRYLYTIEPRGDLALFTLNDGRRVLSESIGGGVPVVSAASAPSGHHVAAALADGRIAMRQLIFTPRYEHERLVDVTPVIHDHGIITAGDASHPVRALAYLVQDERRFVAAITGDRTITYVWLGAGIADPVRAQLEVRPDERVTHVAVGRNGSLLAGTDTGVVYHWQLDDQPRLTDRVFVTPAPITALEWMLGGNSWTAAASDGSISGWLRAPVTGGAGDLEVMARAHTFEPQARAVNGIALSARERSFATVGEDGAIVLRHQTSERVLAAIPSAGPVHHALIAPKANALLVLGSGAVTTYRLENPHPETSWKTLFGKVWYEGYAKPEYVWQSTGATDDVEPKFSLVPLVFGTIKGTLYAMLFAVPLAVLAALYTSQFVDPVYRARIKPTVEIMAALPSVVIGFLAGLYLAAIVERQLVAVLLMIPLMPIAGTSGVLLWRRLPPRIAGRLRPGSEIAAILALLVLAGWIATLVAPFVEARAFGGDARLWMNAALGLTYDQRNCLVVGIAMGFAVIPIIFTIAEDACSSVPSSLTAASLALGASRSQTAVHIVLPTASPGIFSAIMIGFGRAVGETMIVLMATGNTPVMDWSIFNGIRTLSANIAVEIPEAPYGGTLYRTLFLAAAMLFVMTFVVNTVAEVIRQRLRERYRAL